MDDLRDRLHQVESNPLPDVWDDVLDRATRHGIEERPSPKRRVLIGTMALLIAALAFAVSLPALRGPGTTDKGLLPASQDGAVQITISGNEDTAATMSSGGSAVTGVPVEVVSAGRADGTVTHGPTPKGTIAGTLQMNSFHFDYAAVAAPELRSISVAGDATIASDPAETVVFAFAPPADQTGPPAQWSPTGQGRMIPLQLPSSFEHLSEGPWRIVVVGRSPNGNLFQFAFQVDVQPADSGTSASFTAQDFVDGTAPLGTELANALGLAVESGFHGNCSWYAGTYNDGSGYCLQDVPGSKVDLVAISEGLRGHRITESELETITRTLGCNQQWEAGNITEECRTPSSPTG